MNTISKNNKTFHDILTKEILKTDNDFTQNVVTMNKAKLLDLIANNVLLNCENSLLSIATDPGRTKLSFEHKNKKYAFDFSVPEMIDYINMPTAIMVYNKPKNPGAVIKLTDIPKLYWSDECSDHTIWDNLDDDAAVNVVGQRVFSEHGGSDNEYFLDFEEGNNRRAFPGLVLIDVPASTEEKIIVYQNIIQGREKAQQFAEGLKSTQCSGQGLYVYQVAVGSIQPPEYQTILRDVAGYLMPISTILPTYIQDIKQVKVVSGPYKI